MIDREVTATRKGDSGEITLISGPWGTRTRSSAVIDLWHEQYRYFVDRPDGEIDVEMVEDEVGKHLRTPGHPGLLEDLPDA